MFRGSWGLAVVFHRPLGYFCPRAGFLSPAAAWGLAHHTFGGERGKAEQEEVGVIYKWNFHGRPLESGFNSEHDSQGSSSLHWGSALQPLWSLKVTIKWSPWQGMVAFLPCGAHLEKPLCHQVMDPPSWQERAANLVLEIAGFTQQSGSTLAAAILGAPRK